MCIVVDRHGAGVPSSVHYKLLEGEGRAQICGKDVGHERASSGLCPGELSHSNGGKEIAYLI